MRWMRAARSGARILRRRVQDASPFLIVRIMLDLLGRDRPSALGEIAKLELPYRQCAQAIIANHADINLPALDILLRNGGRADAFVDEADAFSKFVIAVDDGGLRDPPGGILTKAFDDEGQREALRPLDFAASGKHGKRRHRNTMIMHQRFGEIFSACKHKAARVAAGIRNAREFEVARNIVVIDDLAAKLLK